MPRSLIPLADDEIHLWYTFPKAIAAPEILAHYDRVMSAEERAKQQRFRWVLIP